MLGAYFDAKQRGFAPEHRGTYLYFVAPIAGLSRMVESPARLRRRQRLQTMAGFGARGRRRRKLACCRPLNGGPLETAPSARMNFGWNRDTAVASRENHGVSFEEAFGDPTLQQQPRRQSTTEADRQRAGWDLANNAEHRHESGTAGDQHRSKSIQARALAREQYAVYIADSGPTRDGSAHLIGVTISSPYSRVSIPTRNSATTWIS